MRRSGFGKVSGIALGLALLVPSHAVPAGAESSAGPPIVHTPGPAPGEVVSAGTRDLSAMIRTEDGIGAIEMTINGDPAPIAEQRHADTAGDVEVRASVELPDGVHQIRLDVEDASGRRASRSWTVTATDRTLERLSGRTRLETAVEVSAALYPEAASAQAAVIARADDFADALAGAPLAAAVDGPLLLTPPEGLPPVVADEVDRVLARGGTVHLLGGEAAISAATAGELRSRGLRVIRHGGTDRFATAAAIAAMLPPSAGAIVASGSSFPDALAASAPAARDGLPILLTTVDHLPEATTRALEDRGVERVTIVGGEKVVGHGVEDALRRTGAVSRVGGSDRYATAVAVVDAFYDAPAGVSLASGEVFPDALAGTRHATARDQPLLLTASSDLPLVTTAALRRFRPEHLTVYGGSNAVAAHIGPASRIAALEGNGGPSVVRASPGSGVTTRYLDAVSVWFDRPVDPAASSVYLAVGGQEIAAPITQRAPTEQLTVDLPDEVRNRFAEGPPGRLGGRAVVTGVDASGRRAHHDMAFTYAIVDPVFASTGPLQLALPSQNVELVGFHEANHDGAQQMEPRLTDTPKVTLDSRNRGTGSRSAADVVAAPDLPVLAPVTGRVIRAGSYVLYCRYTDHFAVIEPDARPGWEVKVLHFEGLAVGVGDRVEASRTVLGAAPRLLPFRSQVDDASSDADWPHVHVEVVDPSIPTRPGTPC